MILNPNESFKKIFSHFVTLSGSIRSLVYTFLVYQKNMYMYVKIYYGGTNPKCRATGIPYKESGIVLKSVFTYRVIGWSSLFFILEGLCHTPVAGFLAILSTFLSKRGFQAYSKYTTVINKIDEKGEKSRKPNKRVVSCVCTF